MKNLNSDNVLQKGIPKLSNTIGISLGIALLSGLVMAIIIAVKDMEELYASLKASGLLFLYFLLLFSLVVSFAGSLICYGRIRQSTAEIAHITNSVHAGFINFILEPGYQITYANTKFYQIIGYQKTEVVKKYNNCFISFVHEEDQQKITELIDRFCHGSYIQTEIRMFTENRNIINVLLNGNFILDKDGNKTLSAVFVDVTGLKEIQNKLIMEEERYRIAAEISNDILFEYKVDKDLMVFADKYKEVYGRSPVIENFTEVDSYKSEMVHPEDYQDLKMFARLLPSGKEMMEAEFRIKNAGSEYIWCHIRGKTIYDNKKEAVSVIGKVVNIDLHKKELQKLEYKAKRDLLTGVYNKITTKEMIEDFLKRKNNQKHILMMIDIDDFKHVNDNYGHLAGDNILVFLIDKIKRIFAGDIIGRIGGDEFLVFIGNISNKDSVIVKAKNLLQALSSVYVVDGQEVTVSGSIGISMYPEDGTTYTELIHCADKALYTVKDEGKGSYKLFT